MKIWQIIGKPNIEFIIKQQLIQKAIKYSGKKLTCCNLHGGTCYTRLGMQFFRAFESLHRIYFIAHLIQFLFYRARKAHKNPPKQLYDFMKGFIKSMLFSAGYSTLGVGFHCLSVRLVGQGAVPYSLCAGLAGLTLLFQPRGRQTQIALFTCKTAIQTGFNQLKRRGLVKNIKGGQCLLAGLVIGILAYYFQNHKDAFRRTYLNLISKVIGEQQQYFKDRDSQLKA